MESPYSSPHRPLTETQRSQVLLLWWDDLVSPPGVPWLVWFLTRIKGKLRIQCKDGLLTSPQGPSLFLVPVCSMPLTPTFSTKESPMDLLIYKDVSVSAYLSVFTSNHSCKEQCPPFILTLTSCTEFLYHWICDYRFLKSNPTHHTCSYSHVG